VLGGTTVRFYVDGMADGTAVSAAPGSYTGDRFLGSRTYVVPDSILGNLGPVQIFNRALSAGEISQIKTAPGVVTSGLIGFWPMFGASTELDRSGQGNNGTVFGTSGTGGPSGVVTVGSI